MKRNNKNKKHNDPDERSTSCEPNTPLPTKNKKTEGVKSHLPGSNISRMSYSKKLRKGHRPSPSSSKLSLSLLTSKNGCMRSQMQNFVPYGKATAHLHRPLSGLFWKFVVQCLQYTVSIMKRWYQKWTRERGIILSSTHLYFPFLNNISLLKKNQ